MSLTGTPHPSPFTRMREVLGREPREKKRDTEFTPNPRRFEKNPLRRRCAHGPLDAEKPSSWFVCTMVPKMRPVTILCNHHYYLCSRRTMSWRTAHAVVIKKTKSVCMRRVVNGSDVGGRQLVAPLSYIEDDDVAGPCAGHLRAAATVLLCLLCISRARWRWIAMRSCL